MFLLCHLQSSVGSYQAFIYPKIHIYTSTRNRERGEDARHIRHEIGEQHLTKCFDRIRRSGILWAEKKKKRKKKRKYPVAYLYTKQSNLQILMGQPRLFDQP